ncbi:MAG: response regulator [bacterium]|jgi:PAS domain S-box-containing protein
MEENARSEPVDELRRAQQELEALRIKYFDLYDMAPVGYFTVSGKGLILEANLRGADLLGVERKRLIRQPLARYIVPEDQDLYYLHRKRLSESGARQEFEIRMCRQDGSPFFARLEMGAERDGENGPPVCRTTVSDITAHKKLEEEKRNLEGKMRQSQKLESMGVLSGGIAHDFNNLLMVVLGHAEMASREIPPTSVVRGNLTEITTAAQRAADLSRQMLAYAGRSVFALERVELRDLLEAMTPLLQAAISKKAILNLDLQRDLPLIQADPSQIRQVVLSLISNASDAIGDRNGVITVSLGARRFDDESLRRTELHDDFAPGLYVRLQVTDTGHGMDAATQTRIFEPFFTTKFAGRGLGLAAVQGIVRAHRGALTVYSEPGKGTTFQILFPAVKDDRKEARTIDASSPSADWRGKGTILLVDDEKSLVDLGAKMLERLGFSVLTAFDGLQAVERYRELGHEIDLVLMDLTMPHMDGANAFAEMRRLNPEVRVVLASGYSPEDVGSRFAGKSIDGVLQKPFTIEKLRETLAGLVPERQAGEA